MKRVVALFVGVVGSRGIDARRAVSRAVRAGRSADRADVRQGRRAHHVRQVRELPPARRGRADVAAVVRGRAAVGARRSRRKVVAREMPPWGADTTQTLADAQRHQPVGEADRDDRGVGGRAVRRAATPPTCRRCRPFATGWTYGKEPDVVLEMPVEFDIPAEGELGVQMFYSKVPWNEDRFAEVVELRPGNRAVVHHAGIFFVDIPEGATLVDGRIVGPDGKVIGDRGSRGPAVDRRRAARIEQAAVVGARPRPRSSSRRRRQAHSGRQVHQLADALQPDRQAGEGSHAAWASGSTRCR